MNFIIIFLYTISALILCSCATETPKTTFDLTPYNFANSMHKYHRKPIQILITQPNSTKYYDSENIIVKDQFNSCLLYTSPSPRDQRGSRMPSSA